jgi:hypothetical protein
VPTSAPQSRPISLRSPPKQQDSTSAAWPLHAPQVAPARHPPPPCGVRTLTVPSDSGSKPCNALRKVDLPPPFGPTTPILSPRENS